MRGGYRIAGFAAVFASVLSFALPAAAQSTPSAIGVPLGGFRLFPTLEVGANYDDNVFRTQAGTKSDFYFEEKPGFELLSQWGRHQLNLHASLDAYQYSSLGSESHNDWNVGGDGRLDILRGSSLSGGGDYSILHEQRTSPDQPGFAKSPTRYALTEANAAFEYHPYHFGFILGGTFARYSYDPTKLIGLPSLNNTDRDRDEFVGFVKGSYEFSPGYAMFVQGNLRTVQYDLALDRTGVQRDNNGFSVNAGLDMLVTNLVKGQIFVGYLNQNYHAPLTDISGFNFGANVDWSATPLWTFHLTASRTLNGTTVANASAEDNQRVALAVDYSILRSVMIRGHVGYNDAVFNGSPREDRYTDAGLEVNYDMNSFTSANLGYNFQNRESTIPGQNFDDNVVTLGLNFHL